MPIRAAMPDADRENIEVGGAHTVREGQISEQGHDRHGDDIQQSLRGFRNERRPQERKRSPEQQHAAGQSGRRDRSRRASLRAGSREPPSSRTASRISKTAMGATITTARRANRADTGMAKNSSANPTRRSMAAASAEGSAVEVLRRTIGELMRSERAIGGRRLVERRHESCRCDATPPRPFSSETDPQDDERSRRKLMMPEKSTPSWPASLKRP